MIRASIVGVLAALSSAVLLTSETMEVVALSVRKLDGQKESINFETTDIILRIKEAL